MSNDIKPGDIVMVVRARPCCGSLDSLGKVSTVARFGFAEGKDFGYCPQCLSEVHDPLEVALLSDGTAKHVSRLKKIPPLTEAGSLAMRRDLEVTA